MRWFAQLFLHIAPQKKIDYRVILWTQTSKPLCYVAIHPQGQLLFGFTYIERWEHDATSQHLWSCLRNVRKIDVFISHRSEPFKISSIFL